MSKRLILFFTAYILWCLLCWVPDVEHLVSGVLVAALVAYLNKELFSEETLLFKSAGRVGYLIACYLPICGFEFIKANIEMVYRILHPGLLIKPGIIKVKVSLKSNIALAFLANTLTLTSGAMCVDVDQQNGVLYLHCVSVQEEEMQSRVERFEKMLNRIFE